MAKFLFKVDTVFEADSLDDACMKLIEHFMKVGDWATWEVDIEARPTFLDHAGSFDLRKGQS
jgi:hypothetical protein